MKNVSQKDFLCKVILLSILFIWTLSYFIFTLIFHRNFIVGGVSFIGVVILFYPLFRAIRGYAYLTCLEDEEIRYGNIIIEKALHHHRFYIRGEHKKYKVKCFLLNFRANLKKAERVTFVIDKKGIAYILDIL